jgi:hypothetical protein
VIRPERIKPLNDRPERRVAPRIPHKGSTGLSRKFDADAYARGWTEAAGA